MLQNPYEAIADLLDVEAVKVRELEKSAHLALYENKDELAYRSLMREKAVLLSSLAENIVDKIGAMDEDRKSFLVRKIDMFSFSASKALEIGSVFYMSALLYPDDYKVGDKNDLELFIDKIRKMN